MYIWYYVQAKLPSQALNSIKRFIGISRRKLYIEESDRGPVCGRVNRSDAVEQEVLLVLIRTMMLR